MEDYTQKAIEMARGGYVSKYATGGVSIKPETTGSGKTVITKSEAVEVFIFCTWYSLGPEVLGRKFNCPHKPIVVQVISPSN